MDDALLVLAGVVGFLVHYLKQWAMGNTESGFLAYMFHNDVKNTVAAVTTFVVAMAGMLAADAQVGFYAAFLTGYAADTVNKG